MHRAKAFRAAPASAIFLPMILAGAGPAGEPPAAEKLYEERALVYTGGDYREHPFKYRLMVPEGCDPKAKGEGKTWPLILFLHGAGERGTDNKAQLKYFPTDMASAESRAKFPCFLLAPQCPAEKWWAPIARVEGGLRADFGPEPGHEARAALMMLDKVIADFPVDRSRIYLTGLSMGGFGSWDLAPRFPERWAAVVPICGGGEPKSAARMKDIPIWVFHGGKDPVVPVDLSHKMVEALKAAGGSPKYTEFPEAGHDSWTPGYRLPEFLPWLFAQKRPSARI
jgi:predicted peptidase